jgi:hypothetical protein
MYRLLRRKAKQSMRLRLRREYFTRQITLLMLLMLMVTVNFLLEFRHHPVKVMGFERDPQVLFEERMLPLIVLFLKAAWNALPVGIALWTIQKLASRFIRVLYDTPEERQEEGLSFFQRLRRALLRALLGSKPTPEELRLEASSNFFDRNVFGMEGIALKPLMIVREGRIALGAGSAYDRIGGPGFLVVHNDSAAVLEKGGRLTRIVSSYLGLLERFERVWEVIDLRPQHWVFPVGAMTKEGIPITCEADISFKIDDRPIAQGKGEFPDIIQTQTQADATIEEELKAGGIKRPYPHTANAVFKAATSIWVRIRQKRHPEQLRKWTGRVMISEVEGALRNILAQYRLDWLMRSSQSEQEYPREEIRKQLEEKLRDTFKEGNPVGARILHVDLGQIDVRSDKISRQWIEAWRADWEQRAVESLAEGEAEFARLETAQIHAQAEVALTLTEAIRPLVTDAGDFPPYLLAMRFVQTLRWMAYNPFRHVFLPPEILQTLGELEKALGQAYGSPQEAPTEQVSPGESLTTISRLLMERRRE